MANHHTYNAGEENKNAYNLNNSMDNCDRQMLFLFTSIVYQYTSRLENLLLYCTFLKILIEFQEYMIKSIF